ncbi:hypothetical protein [Nocardiopsis coralliicola]
MPLRPGRPDSSEGPTCLHCAHSTCRTHRAAALPRLGGHRAEYAAEHARAAAIQRRHRHLIVYFGEATQSYWAATPHGLIEARDTDALLLALWPHGEGGQPAGPRQQYILS